MEHGKQPDADRVGRYLFHQLIPRISWPQAIAVGKIKFLAVKFLDQGLGMYRDP